MSKRSRFACAVMLCAWLGFGSVGAHAQANPTIFEVGDATLTLQDLRDFVAKRPHYRSNLATRAGLDELVYEMLDARLFRLEGERLGMTPPPGVKPEDDGYYFTVQYATIERCVAPDEDEVKAYYDANPFRFSTPALVRVSRVIAPAAATIEGVPAETYLRDAAGTVGGETTQFDELVGKVAAALPAPSSFEMRQGDLGFQQVPPAEHLADAFERQLLKASVGEIIGPLSSGDAIVLVKVTDRREPIVTPWPQARDEVSKTMLKACADEMRWKKRKELFERYKVVVHEDVIRALQPSIPGQ